MKVEIQTASNFLANLLRIKCPRNALPEQFAARLEQLLGEHYTEHWFPESPCKGSGYRCIRINHKMDPILSRVGAECGFNDEGLRDVLPRELTLWIDPQEVSYRIGENGSICVLYEGSKTSKWSPSTPKAVGGQRKPSTDSDDSCSPMSISPPSSNSTPLGSSCKESLTGTRFIMDPRSINFELCTFVAS